MRVRDVLNKIYWHKDENKSDYEILFIHRGAPNNLKSFSANDIIKIGKESVNYKNKDDDVVTIPFHRIILIRNIKTGKILWKKGMLMRDDEKCDAIG
ncbi:MAG: RNA repair domain-containing protein [Candidatus Methanomethylicia archaeon]